MQQHARLIHIGHFDEMHYVSTSPVIQPSQNQINCSNKEKQITKKHEQYLKRKASETKEQWENRLARARSTGKKRKRFLIQCKILPPQQKNKKKLKSMNSI